MTTPKLRMNLAYLAAKQDEFADEPSALIDVPFAVMVLKGSYGRHQEMRGFSLTLVQNSHHRGSLHV